MWRFDGQAWAGAVVDCGVPFPNPRPAMRFIAPLDEETQDRLRSLMHSSDNVRVRQRAHAILLSAKRYRIGQIADIFEVDRDTVSRWLTNWNERRFDGLADEARPGRPRALKADEEDRALAIALEEPRQIKLGLGRIEQLVGRRLSLDWLRGRLRQRAYRYKRLRASLRRKREEAAFRQAQQELGELQRREAAGEIDLYYGDESGFALRPALAYAWQPVGKRIEVEHTGREQINVLGLLRRDGEFVPFTAEDAVTSETVSACLDYFAARLRRKTVLVLDNAPVHKSKAVKACLGRWAAQGLHVKYLPSYSPELNVIEHLWRKMKYQWMPLSAYERFEKLKQALDEILAGVGTKYRITFS